MIPALRHLDRLPLALARHAVDQALFAADPARPPAREVAAERFGLAGAPEGVAAAFFEEGVDLGEDLRVAFQPEDIMIPGPRGKCDLHG